MWALSNSNVFATITNLFTKFKDDVFIFATGCMINKHIPKDEQMGGRRDSYV